MTKSETSANFRLCVIVENPVSGVIYALQRRHGELDKPSRTVAKQGSFEAVIRVRRARTDGQLTLLGEFLSGPVADRFIYINSGQRAGQADSCWDHRAKIKLHALPINMIEEALQPGCGGVEGRIAGRALGGGPCCATVSLIGSGWAPVV